MRLPATRDNPLAHENGRAGRSPSGAKSGVIGRGKAGDRILFGKYSGTEIKIDGEEFLIMREEEVLGILIKK